MMRRLHSAVALVERRTYIAGLRSGLTVKLLIEAPGFYLNKCLRPPACIGDPACIRSFTVVPVHLPESPSLLARALFTKTYFFHKVVWRHVWVSAESNISIWRRHGQKYDLLVLDSRQRILSQTPTRNPLAWSRRGSRRLGPLHYACTGWAKKNCANFFLQ